MALTKVNGHTIIPHLADWSTPPSRERQRASLIRRAAAGAADAAANRDTAFESWSWSVFPFDLEERAILEARILAASAECKACCPKFGMGWPLASSTSGELLIARSFTLEEAWPFPAVGDYIVMIDEKWSTPGGARWEAGQITGSSDPGTYTVAWASRFGAIDYEFRAGSFVWPLLFGRFQAERSEPQSGRISQYRMTLSGPTPILSGLGASSWTDPVPLV